MHTHPKRKRGNHLASSLTLRVSIEINRAKHNCKRKANRFHASPFMIVQELHKIQHEHGYLPEDQLRALSQRTGEPLHRLHEVASFFPHYQLQPPPAAEVKVCCDMACHLAGGETLCRCLDEAGKQARGQVAVKRVSCLGRCDGARPSPSTTRSIGTSHKPNWKTSCKRPQQGNRCPSRDRRARAEVADRSLRRPAELRRDSPLGRGLEGRCRPPCPAEAGPPGRSDPEDPGRGQPAGHGRRGFPTLRKWTTVRNAPGDVKYVVCNGDESEPGTFKDRDLLLFAPHLLVEGMVIAGLVSGAQRGYIYIRHEYQEQIEAVRAEIARAAREGFCGDNLLGTNLDFPVEVFVSPGGYICGEESALLEAMEDRRAEPRNKPPLPVYEGLRGSPTIVNNVETLSWVPALVLRGGAWYRDSGTHGAAGMRFVSISGHVARPGVYEVPFGQTVRELIYDSAGGMSGGRKLKAIAPSGPSGGFLPAVTRPGARVARSSSKGCGNGAWLPPMPRGWTSSTCRSTRACCSRFPISCSARPSWSMATTPTCCWRR